MPPNTQNARDGGGHASVLEISEGRSTSEITELPKIVKTNSNRAPETAMAAALREALRRKARAS
jgi:hypothetical protein